MVSRWGLVDVNVPDDLAVAVSAGGDMGRRLAAYDWASHPLGRPEEWSPTRRALVSVALMSRFPILLWLGDELFLVYNDAYAPMLGDKHPDALGRPGAEVWWDVWDVVGPMIDGVLASGVATWSEDLQLMMQRTGYLEEAYFTFTYSPIVESDGRASGVFCAVTETTERVLGERRLAALRDMAAGLVDRETVAAVATATVDCAGSHPADLRFVAFYGRDDDGAAQLLAATPALRQLLPAGAAMEVWHRGTPGAEPVVLDVPDGLRFAGAGAEPVERALVLPLVEAAAAGPTGWLVVGLNPNRAFDDDYRSFCNLMAAQVATAVSGARAHEHERRRAESLAELDAAKTTFFSNVSHEFRTPLTLMLAPLEELLDEDGEELPETHRARVALAHRNGLRMMRLVNALLDISRLDSGRLEPNFQPIDLAGVTVELAALFRDVFRRADLSLDVAAEETNEPAWVDVRMWETIVLNLLSNALKYTFAGGVQVRLWAEDGSAILTVADTGVGIAPEELPSIFDRFQRSRNAQARSAEGAGIGLALVKSMVELLGGSITVASELDKGTSFTVSVPLALDRKPVETAAHAKPIGASSPASKSYVAEALRWLGGDEVAGAGARDTVAPLAPSAARVGRVLVVDDNADMRDYLHRVLGMHWTVRTARDGRAALDLAQTWHPHVVVSDVMMPDTTGIELAAAMRADAALRDTELILVSARAGAAAELDGVEAGADDYLTKPFRAEELVRRVAARLERRMRRLEEERAALLSRLGATLNEARSIDALIARTVAALAELIATSVVVAVGEGELLRLYDAGSLIGELSLRYRTLAVDAPHPVAAAYREGVTLAFGDLDTLVAGGYSSVAAEIRSLGYHASISIPLRVADGTVIGALTCSWLQPVDFDQALLDFFERVGDVVSRTLERVRLFDRERDIAETLERELLRTDLRSQLAAVAALYRPAASPSLIGGDWYDAFETLDGRLAVVVGDVVGSGIPAAGVMASLRAACSATLAAGSDVGSSMTTIDALSRRLPDADCTTVSVGVLSDDGTFEVALAGHPSPVVATPGAPASLLDVGRSTPLAVTDPPMRRSSARVELPGGSLVVMYTDGLVERRNARIDDRFAQLLAAVDDVRHLPTSLVCSELVERLVSEHRRDDVAVLAMRVAGMTPETFTHLLASDPAAMAPARHRLRAWLEGCGFAPAVVDDVVLAVGEAITNAVEHGGRSGVRRTVTIEAGLADGQLVVCVRDQGQWDRDSTESARTAERGRGLAIMNATMDAVEIRSEHFGTTLTMWKRVARGAPVA